MRKVIKLVLAFFAILMPFALFAAKDYSKKETILIINSYNADEEWSVNMSRPVERFVVKSDSIICDIVYLNNSSVKNMDDFDELCDNLFDRYKTKHPNYIVMIGNFGIALRDKIKENWGNIPILLISRIETYAPIEEYFANVDNDDNVEVNNLKPLGNLRDKYNFTAIIVPDFYNQNIDLMMELNPKMKEVVLLSDMSFINKVAAMNLQSIVKEQYPDLRFSWVKGTYANSRKLPELFMTPNPDKGFILSSWAYEVTTVRGQNILTSQDLAYIPEANNPIFTMRQHYLSLGCVGGVFTDNGFVTQHIEEVLKKMVQGESMSKIPFFEPHKYITCVDYIAAKRYNLDVEKLPSNVILMNTPLSFMGQYGHLVIIIIVALIIIIAGFWYKNHIQHKQIKVLERHTGFINNLPMPYTKASLWLDKKSNVVNITYGIKNTAYDELIHNNSLPDNPLHLFSNTFMSDITNKLLTTNTAVSIRHHFKRTDVYCYFIFVPIEKKNIEMKTADSDSTIKSRLDIDVFAIDMTKDHKLQQQLKDQAITIDISMEMAQLVPWQWDFETDIISFYTYRKYIGTNGTTTSDGKSTTAIKFDQFIRLLPQDDAESMLNLYHAIRDGETNRIDNEFRIARAENPDEYDWVENHGVVTDTDSDGRPLRMTGSLQYITDRKLQEEEMGLALSKAKESDMLKSAFLANMSHEIRTPLNAIVGFSNLLTTTDDPKERKDYADIINRNNELLLSLINDILDLAKIESNTVTITYDLCDIHDLVSSISKTVSIRVPKGVKLNVVHFAESLLVKADAAHISQILINLLTNATKFTKRGSITVGYEVYEDENKIFFYVKDTGIGIKKENLDKVFNRFVKLNNFVQGSGLGLAICRTLVEKMGGEIGVESSGEGRGTQFWFTIPYDPQDLKVQDTKEEVIRDAFTGENIIGEKADAPAKVQERQSQSSFLDSSEGTQSSLGAMPDGLTVLVAEDNPSNYWLMERLMQGKFKLHHAENGKLAVEMYDKVQPDLIIMDINMPEMDGYQAVEEMRKNGVDVPIIAVTAYAFASDRVRILNSGFDAFVSKPVSASLLYDTMAEVWERKKLKKDKKQN